jgi:hypothetical protein
MPFVPEVRIINRTSFETPKYLHISLDGTMEMVTAQDATGRGTPRRIEKITVAISGGAERRPTESPC